jgi:thiopurine S-methyltransferase
MEPEFWHQRWRENLIGFHQQTVNPHLQRFWPGLGVASDGGVLVPLCGKSRDMLWLRDKGHPVLGVELSPIAVEDFFRENGLSARTRELQRFTLFEAGAVRILCGDFFDLEPDMTGNIAAVYDRASLIALPAPLRAKFVRQLGRLVPAGTPMLLVTLEYNQAQMNGPPFAVEESEMRALFADTWSLEILLEEDILAAEPRFRERGLSRLFEKIYLLHKQ